jgi:BirA family biotin operon repressor/biotin-[acetyl-CoA-carboxylase] ligase
LEHNKEDYISGEYMAESLGLSRTAVWKAIKELRNQGYVIEASSKKGYILGTSNDIISESGILAELSEYCSDKHYEKKEKILSGVISEHGMIHIHETLDSTNRTAKELAIAGAPGGTVVIARSQTLGRGRREHEFFSPEGGIYMSIILTPDMLPSLEPDVVTALAGVSVCEAVQELCGAEPRIKPVNDLFVAGKKICGILTESGTEFDTGTVQWIVIGIGINFDSDMSLFPKDLQSIAGALFEPGKTTVTKNRLIAAIICNLSRLSTESTKGVLKAYNDRVIK